jgi:hypothetical protein
MKLMAKQMKIHQDKDRKAWKRRIYKNNAFSLNWMFFV